MATRLIRHTEAASAGVLFAPHTLPTLGPGGQLAPSREKGLPGAGSAAQPLAYRPHGSAVATATATAPARPAPTADGQHAGEAERVLAEARAEAARIVAAASANAADIEREARERGLAEAQVRIAAETAQAVEPLRERLAQTLDELETLRAAMAARSERDLVRLALEIAKRVVHREVTMDHEIVLTLARVALERLHNRAVATVHLHPEDYQYILTHRDRLETGRSIEILEDRAVARGGCLVSTEMGDVDARLEQQFAEIERGFFSL